MPHLQAFKTEHCSPKRSTVWPSVGQNRNLRREGTAMHWAAPGEPITNEACQGGSQMSKSTLRFAYKHPKP